MTVPGSNLLNMALSLIGPQPVAWAAFSGMTTNAAGIDVPTWAAAVTVYGSFQPASNTLLQTLGLDWNKNYAIFYASQAFTEPDRDMSGDRLTYAGKTYQVESGSKWFTQDGWEGVLCVEVTNA